MTAVEKAQELTDYWDWSLGEKEDVIDALEAARRDALEAAARVADGLSEGWLVEREQCRPNAAAMAAAYEVARVLAEVAKRIRRLKDAP